MGPTLAGWPDLDDDTVRERWLTGLALAYAAISPDTDEPVGATVARVVLAALAADPTASFTDLSRPAREALSFAHPDAAITFLLSWRTKTDPLAAAVDPLIDFGAAVHSHGGVIITPLGYWALETLRARAPRPISTDLTATELLTRLTQIDEEEQWYAAQTWLAGRAPLPASRDLLAAAATATPAQRLAAVELVHALGPRADAAWGEAEQSQTWPPTSGSRETTWTRRQRTGWRSSTPRPPCPTTARTRCWPGSTTDSPASAATSGQRSSNEPPTRPPPS